MSRLMQFLSAVLLAAGLLFQNFAHAHKASDAYVQLNVVGAEVNQRFDIALRDLERDLGLDANDDGQLTWQEVRSRWGDIDRLALQGLSLRANSQDCLAGAVGTPQLETHSDGQYAVILHRWTCAEPIRELSASYSLFSQTDPTHRGIFLVREEKGGRSESAVMVPGAKSYVFSIASGNPSGAASFGGFFIEGIHHILIGTDHVLFLLSLLLPSVLIWKFSSARPGTVDVPSVLQRYEWLMPRWSTAGPVTLGSTGAAMQRTPTPSVPRSPQCHAAHAIKPVLMDVLRIITAFTVAHSFTLALAVFDVINPPSRWIESIIAASVAFAALNNLLHFHRSRLWKITFVFGLVHGFGFAGALKDLGLAQGNLAMPLFAFNLGVELGQLSIVALFLLVAWPMRSTKLYQKGVLPIGSGLIALIAVAWLIERAFDMKLGLPI